MEMKREGAERWREHNMEILGSVEFGKQPNCCHFDQSLEQGEENILAMYTDDYLNERIQANKKLLKSFGHRSKDKGENIRKKLAQLCEEQDKRLQRSMTGNQENGHEKSKSPVFSGDLEIVKGIHNNVDVKTGSVGKSNSNYKLPEEMTCRGQKCNSSNTVSVSSFNSSSGDLSFDSKKHFKNFNSSNEAEKSIASGVASGKRNRSTSPCTYDPKDEKLSFGRSPPVFSRQMMKTTNQESVSNQKNNGRKDSLGASLDDERRGLEDARKEGFRVTYPREVLLDMIEKNAVLSLKHETRIAATTYHPIVLPTKPSLHDYFTSIRYEGKKHVYGSIKKTGAKEKSRKKEDGPVQSQLDAASYWLLYRYFLYLRELKLIVELPEACKAWVDITNKESTMYGENMRTLSPFEIETCPWWIDMPSPHVLPREKEKFEEWQRSKGKEAFQEVMTIVGDRRKGKEAQKGEMPQEGWCSSMEQAVRGSCSSRAWSGGSMYGRLGMDCLPRFYFRGLSVVGGEICPTV